MLGREGGLPTWRSGKEPACQRRRCQRWGLHPWVGKILWRRKWEPTPVFLPGASHGQRSLVGYSPWGRKEYDTTEQQLERAPWGPELHLKEMKLSLPHYSVSHCPHPPLSQKQDRAWPEESLGLAPTHWAAGAGRARGGSRPATPSARPAHSRCLAAIHRGLHRVAGEPWAGSLPDQAVAWGGPVHWSPSFWPVLQGWDPSPGAVCWRHTGNVCSCWMLPWGPCQPDKGKQMLAFRPT